MQTKTLSLGSGRILTILISGVLSLIAFVAAVYSGPLNVTNLFLVTSCYFSLQVCVMNFMVFSDEESSYLDASRRNNSFTPLLLGVARICTGAWIVSHTSPANDYVGSLFWTGVALWFLQSGFRDICNVSYLGWIRHNERQKMGRELQELQNQDDLCADLEGFLFDADSAGNARKGGS